MPLPQFIKDLYFAFFDAYLREPVTMFVYALYKYWAPMIELKLSFHILVDCLVPYLPEQEIFRLNIFFHAEIIGLFNVLLVLQYYFLWFLLYKLKEIIRLKYFYGYFREKDAIIAKRNEIDFYKRKLMWPLIKLRRKKLIRNYVRYYK